MKGTDRVVSAARQRLRQRAGEMRYSLRELSLLIERNATYLTQYVNKGSPRELTERDRQRLGFLLKMSPQDLSDATGVGKPARGEPARATMPVAAAPAGPMPGSGVPVLSVALVGDAMGRVPADAAVEIIDRPRALDGVRNGFALRVSSNAFFPAFRPGDIAFVHPNIPPLPGDLVCVTGSDGRLLLGRLAADALPERPRVLSFGDFQEIAVAAAQVEKVVAVHYR